MHIRANDIVEVIAGFDRGTRAKVLRVLIEERKIVVEGVNRVYKHVRRSQKNPRGGRLFKEMPVSISNVMLVCPACSRPTRTGARLHDDGSKHRVCKRKTCGKEIGQLSPPREKNRKKPATAKA
ncbi:MAG TPA: 50S ribosomal protein L24 [Pirellulales bacterium]|jgi:large subunit ribosomal protein L24|nr:50S ribosomal protein L24 [Pirellulales bacterium]